MANGCNADTDEKRLVPVRQHRRLPDGSIPPLSPFLTVVWEYRIPVSPRTVQVRGWLGKFKGAKHG